VRINVAENVNRTVIVFRYAFFRSIMIYRSKPAAGERVFAKTDAPVGENAAGEYGAGIFENDGRLVGKPKKLLSCVSHERWDRSAFTNFFYLRNPCRSLNISRNPYYRNLDILS